MFELPPPRQVRYVSQQKVFPRKRHVCLHHLFLCCFFTNNKNGCYPVYPVGNSPQKKCKLEKLHRVVCGFSLASLCGWNHPIICIDVCIPGTQMTSISKGQPSKTRPFPIKTRVIYGFQVYVYSDSYSYIYERFVIHIFGNRSFKFENVLSVFFLPCSWCARQIGLSPITNYTWLKTLNWKDSPIPLFCVIVSCSQKEGSFPIKTRGPSFGFFVSSSYGKKPKGAVLEGTNTTQNFKKSPRNMCV